MATKKESDAAFTDEQRIDMINESLRTIEAASHIIDKHRAKLPSHVGAQIALIFGAVNLTRPQAEGVRTWGYSIIGMRELVRGIYSVMGEEMDNFGAPTLADMMAQALKGSDE